MSPPDLTPELEELVARYQLKIAEKDAEIERLNADLIALTIAATKKGILKELPPENEDRFRWVI